ncbi:MULTISPECIES: glycosyltransferase family 2 protein [unclassified Fibrobacter]|uniref:glycosyltransferase family 2 protein n=1 Tax=unclassified Fibrobacter TaxID=2634177 RepID=UPI000D6AF968|nr:MULTISPECIES: glycosyltransferase family 2 protein [unclassified Fibrobacter]PWJ63068.1 glycosyltransferase involved in cell wall biosynthesis [Fibrobacter sp. UWR4]PZW61954.1 glycosyltransferase involved in cell wall biosynthesis [Fibrobacter sp. UWR1]
MPLITIFTPTYNRKDLIERLYQSLLLQTQKCFEWVVIDDGSTDNTESFFTEIQATEQPFSIRYVKQQNGGKHRAINKGVSIAKGELFFIVDSDDTLLPQAIEKICQWDATLDNSHKWAGLAGLRGKTESLVIGQRNNSAPFVDAKNSERQQKSLEGDKAEVYFTEVLRKYPFPEIPGEKFISEEIVWNAIARDGYYLRWFNEIIYTCDYLDGGLTKDNSKERNNPEGCLLWAKGQLETFPDNSRKRFLAIAIYRNAVKHVKNISTTAKELSVSPFSVVAASLMLSIYQPLFNLLQRNKH